ncbi:aromatic motif membrane protein [Metamycoplasma hominis]|uniref:aromatic motif membrane protein n=1 Tax=Metamycoplasma hominis TaxID=2098 RepID=UPI000A573B35|nr:aromatic motif membrane protein [Metamycoplasma hominis]
MKKLLKISLSLPLVIATIPLVASSCKQTNIEIKKPDDKKETANQIQAKINKEFQKNKVVQKLLSSFIENEKEQDIFVQNQNNILPNVYSELKFSLLYFPIYNRASDNPGSELYGFIRQSREIIENTLQRNWYWYLKQIGNFVYSINPYNDRYIETSQTKKQFNLPKKTLVFYIK